MPFSITVLNTSLFAFSFLFTFYVVTCLLNKRLILPDIKTLFEYVTLFSLFGVVGEVFSNTLYKYLFGTQLWDYHLFPAHDGNISYFFLFIWGSLGIYKYFSNYFIFKRVTNELYAGLLMAIEAIFLELLYNGTYFLFFHDYIFYYLPANLSVLSHFSCLQVVPFYFMFGLVATTLINIHMELRSKKILFLYAFYWMTIVTFVFLS